MIENIAVIGEGRVARGVAIAVARIGMDVALVCRDENLAQESLNNARKYTNSNMEELGGLKLKLYRETLLDFVEIFSEIKNVDFEDKLDLNFSIADIDFKNILEIKNDSLKIIELAGGANAALGGGALAGFGAFGGAGMLATA